MSKDVSLSPKSEGYGDGRVDFQVEVVDEEKSASLSQLGFTTTLSSSYAGPEELDDSLDDLASLPKDKKKPRGSKSMESEPQRKRKDTASSFTSFFHRFTRSEKEEKKIVEEEEGRNEDGETIGRPDKLVSPDSEERWFEPTSVAAHDGESIGHEGGAIIYEWDSGTMNETIVLPPLEQSPAHFEEKGLVTLLEQFRNGEMRWLDDPQLEAMCEVKEAHEEISNTHLKVFEIQSERRRKHHMNEEGAWPESESEDDELATVEALFDEMNTKMVKMHEFFDSAPFYDALQSKKGSNQSDD